MPEGRATTLPDEPAAAGGPAAAGKHPALLVREAEPLNAGPPPELQRATFVTPTELFFVRNHAPVPRLDPAALRLSVGGLVRRPLELSLGELAERFPRAEVTATLQCAGQRRDELAAVRPIPGELPWGAEPVSNARWAGVRLADVLAAAGPDPAAAHAVFRGLDEVEREGRRFGFGGSVPLAKALSPEVLLASEMNGEPLPPVHGGPLRVLVPGYVGARSVKWLGEIELSTRSSNNYFQARAYRLYPPHVTKETADPAQAFELGELAVTSTITAPRPGDPAGPGPVRVEGIALAGGGRRVERVDLSGDRGATWTPARLGAEGDGWTWRLFDGAVDLAPGCDEIVARAWDSAAQTQPESPAAVWNHKGYMNSSWARVRVRPRRPGA